MPRNLREYMIEKVHPQLPGKKWDFTFIVICILKANLTKVPPFLVETVYSRSNIRKAGEKCFQLIR